MKENWSNNRLILNGRVNPPIVLHDENEMLIAQNAHNLVWAKYRHDFDEIEKKAETEESRIEAKNCMMELNAKAKPEIDELIITEINTYRKARADSPAFDFEERIEQLEERIDDLESELEDIRSELEDIGSETEGVE